MHKLKRHYLSKRDVKELLERSFKLNLKIGEWLKERVKEVWEVAKGEKFNVYLIGGRLSLIDIKGVLVPSTWLAEAVGLPRVVVDEGAVPKILNGADVMVPGIVKLPERIEKGNVVAIAEERCGKVIGVGIALMSANEVLEVKRGKSLKVLHRVGDEVWRMFKS